MAAGVTVGEAIAAVLAVVGAYVMMRVSLAEIKVHMRYTREAVDELKRKVNSFEKQLSRRR